MHVMLIFLLVNGIRLNCSNEDVVEAGLGVASGTMDYEQLLQWIIRHKEIKIISTYEKGRRIDLIGRFLRPFALIGAALLFLASNDKDHFIGHITIYN